MSLLLAQARVHDAVNAADKASALYRAVIVLDGSNVESVASLAALQFYSDQPEVGLRYYRRLLQMGSAPRPRSSIISAARGADRPSRAPGVSWCAAERRGAASAPGPTQPAGRYRPGCGARQVRLAGAVVQPRAVLLRRRAVRHGAHLLRARAAGRGAGPPRPLRLRAPLYATKGGAAARGCARCREREKTHVHWRPAHVHAPDRRTESDRAGSPPQDTLGDVWYNVSHVAIGIGDLGLAYQALKVAVAADPAHAEAHNNLAVLELKKGNIELSRAGFREAARLGPHAFEPPFNSALLAHKLGETQEAFDQVNKSLICWPEHTESKELIEILRSRFS